MPPMAAALHLNCVGAAVEGVTPADFGLGPNETPKTTNVALWRCVAHRAQLAVNDIFGDDGVDSNVKALIVKVRDVCKAISASATLSTMLRDVQREGKQPELTVSFEIAAYSLAIVLLTLCGFFERSFVMCQLVGCHSTRCLNDSTKFMRISPRCSSRARSIKVPT